MHLTNALIGPLYKGFTIDWRPNPAKDPEGKDRFVIELR
jgi:hypothetical protein